MSTRTAAVLGPQTLPRLPLIDAIASLPSTAPAIKRIQSDTDVLIWQKSDAHEVLVLFLARLCESAVGKSTRVWIRNEESSNQDQTDCILELLDELQNWTSEIEPLKTPQRFGNLAFRSWGQRLEEKISSLHHALLPIALQPYIPELQEYLLGGFGSWIRLDYGSGHELSFLAWLCFLVRLGALPYGTSDSIRLGTEERLALEVIPKYLQVVWGLQDRYGLEPAGSHGVWGLDDYQFIPYAIGAAQLRNQSFYLPSAIISPLNKPEQKLAIDQLLQFIPSSSLSLATRTSTSQSQPPFANLYTTSIARIHSLKRGPFAEHSPILYDIATTVPNWIKVHGGMMKMWQAECLGKRPVVQHFPFGGVGFVWKGDASRVLVDSGDVGSEKAQGQGRAMPATAAPWQTSNAGMPATEAPWKQNHFNLPVTAAPWARTTPPTNNLNMASTGSAAAASSPFGIISKPTVPSRSRKE